MSTTSIVPEALDALVDNLGEAMTGANAAVTVHEAWPGPDGSAEMVVFGEVIWPEYRIPTIKAGRKYRDEEFNLAFEVLIFGTDGSTPADPTPARNRAFAVLAVLEDFLADDPRAGLANDVIKWAELKPATAGPHLFERGWAYRIAGAVVGKARLT